MLLKKYIKLLLVLALFFSGKWNAQVCGGSFGAPIFTEDFGSVTASYQVVSPPLAPPAFTNYFYSSIMPPNDKYYTISNFSGTNVGWPWINVPDHTDDGAGNYGNMLVVNADDNKAGEFYRRRVSGLCPNQVYRFSAWIINLIKPNTNIIKPNVVFRIESTSGVTLGQISTGDLAETGDWKNYYIDFKSSISSGDVDVVLINNNIGGNGNDLAIDDISFSPCGPATSVTATIGNVFTTGVCDNSQSFTLTAQMSANTFQNVNYIWQKSTDGGTSWFDLTPPTSNPNLYVLGGTYNNNDKFRFIVGESSNINISTCRVFSDIFTVKINGYPAAPNSQIFNFCQNSTGNSITANGSNLLWYTAATGGIGDTLAPTVVTNNLGTFNYWVSQTTNGCESARSKITVNIVANPNPPIVNNLQYCQNSTAVPLSANGTNLLWYTASTGGTGNATAPTPDTSVAGNFSFWVSQNNGTCESARAEIKVTVLPVPHSASLKDTSICDGEKITLRVTEPDLLAEWQISPPTISQTLDVTIAGQYAVKLTDSNGCTAIQTVNVTKGVTPIITQIKSGENFLEILAIDGNPPYLYSLDNVNWQTSNIFSNLNAGIYQVYVKSQTNSCTAVAKSAVLFIPNAFTPNQDTFNDVWRVTNIEFFKNAKLKIFDRLGNEVFHTEDVLKFNWDGFSNGRLLPTGTYWYFIEIENNYARTGWIFLKNH